MKLSDLKVGDEIRVRFSDGYVKDFKIKSISDSGFVTDSGGWIGWGCLDAVNLIQTVPVAWEW